MALLIASSASTEQWIFTGGKLSSSTICEFLIVSASSTVLPLIHSVASDELAIAEPQPNVLNFASSMMPWSLTLICSRITSPHAGAPTRPVPTVGSLLSSVPTFRGDRKSTRLNSSHQIISYAVFCLKKKKKHN